MELLIKLRGRGLESNVFEFFFFYYWKKLKILILKWAYTAPELILVNSGDRSMLVGTRRKFAKNRQNGLKRLIRDVFQKFQNITTLPD